jgi:hypothetical protein
MGRTRSEAVPRRGKGAAFVRFAHESEPYGVFSYLDDAKPRLNEPDREEVGALVAWFSEHLDEPATMVPARAEGRGVSEPSAVCWFRTSARDHVRRARRLALLVRRARIPIIEWRREVVPGEICSEDAHQIATAAFWE